jgi:hypothetical protein
MFFADDVVLIDESRIRVDQKLKLWRHTFRLSRTKTEYIWWQFSGDNSDGGDVKLDEQIVLVKDTFRYLRSILQSDGGIEEDVSHWMRTEWVK